MKEKDRETGEIEEVIKRLTINGDGKERYEAVFLYKCMSEICENDNPRITPEPKPPAWCSHCEKRNTFKPLFPDEVKALYGSKLHVPWLLPREPMSCDFLSLYTEIQDYVQKHLVLSKPEQYDIVALWIMATWKVDDFFYCPYILFRGEIESGKTRALDVINRLAYHAIPTVGITPAVLRRQISWFRCTCAIDQAEDQLNRKFEAGQEMYRLVAAGYKKGMFVARCRDGSPDKIDYDDPFGFKAFASTKSFDAAIDSRSIILDMEEAIPENLDIDESWARQLRSKLLYWRLSEDFIPSIVDTELRGRTRELFMSLLCLGEFTESKATVEKFALEHQQARKMELLDELKAAIVDIIRKLETTAVEGHVYVQDIKETLGERGLDISSSWIGRNLSNLDLPRQLSPKGRYIDLTDETVNKKLQYWITKYGLEKGKEEEDESDVLPDDTKEAQNELFGDSKTAKNSKRKNAVAPRNSLLLEKEE